MIKIKRLTEEQSREYISVEEDFTSSPPVYYTILPDVDSPEWDSVKYYTARKKNLYSNVEGDGDSWIYVLTNPVMPNLVKIGFTSKTPDERAREVSRSTGVPVEFTVAYAFKCFNAHSLEAEIHKYLCSYRVNNDREFFQIDVQQAKETILELGQRYK